MKAYKPGMTSRHTTKKKKVNKYRGGGAVVNPSKKIKRITKRK